jgi:putative ABC transport system permease protein
MFRTSLRNLTSRPLRTALTTLAILLGVAMISGTYVLTDQITNGFNDIFKTAYKGTAVVVQPKVEFGQGDGTTIPSMPETLVADVQGVDGVANVDPSVEALGAVLVDDKVVKTGGAPTLILSAEGDSAQITWKEGGRPGASGQVAVNTGFADKNNVKIGDHIALATAKGTVPVTVSGIFNFGNASSLGGTIMVAALRADVQNWYDLKGKLTSISLTADPGVTPEELAARVRAVLPASLDVKTGEQAAADASSSTSGAINSFLRPALLAFGGVAVFVGAFIIFNAFSITVAQRLREFALLRALGSSRRQVLTGVIVEALIVGVAASVTGLFAGLGVAKAITQLFKAVGADFPVAGLGLAPRTVIVALLVGVGTALVAALIPALRATRVPPVAALQEGAVLPESRIGRFSTPLAVLVAVAGTAVAALGFFGDATTSVRLLEMGGGAMLLFVAVAMVARHVVRPLTRVIGWPLERLGGTSGRLARENAGRNPARTASTAAALMIGLGLVVFVAVFAQGLKSSFIDVFDTTVAADVVAFDNTSYQPLPKAGIDTLRTVPGVETVAGLASTQVKIGDNSPTYANAISPTDFAKVWKFDWVEGNDSLLTKLDATTAIGDEQWAKGQGVAVGDTFTVSTQSGKTAELTLLGTYRDPVLLNGLVVANAAFERLDLPVDPQITMAKGAPGTDPNKLKASVEAALKGFPTQTVYTQKGYKDFVSKQINQLLLMLYALLAMSVTISAFGIVNTLVLSVYERTREIGMLRAIGTSRRQMRRIVRYESVITSVIGGLMGTVVGVVFAYAVTTRFADQGFTFSVPFGQLGIFLVVAMIVGVLAAVLPARRASRVNILEAIHYE